MKKTFADDLNTAVFTTKFVLSFDSPILYAYHFDEDGAWQFSGSEECVDEDYRIITLEEMINIDSSILNIADLSFGYYAYRNDKASEWIVQKIED
jgi:hypothetical protein